jgi:hypothetical protein
MAVLILVRFRGYSGHQPVGPKSSRMIADVAGKSADLQLNRAG